MAPPTDQHRLDSEPKVFSTRPVQTAERELVELLPSTEGVGASWLLPPRTTEVARARFLVALALGYWGVPDEVTEDTVLIASELVTNAHQHARGQALLGLKRTDVEVTVLVVDNGRHEAGAFELPPIDDEAEGGRGLRLVDALATQWGHRPERGGKAVWATVRLEGRR